MWNFLKNTYFERTSWVNVYIHICRTETSLVEGLLINAGDPGSIPGSGRPPGEGNGNPLQYSCLGNPMHREAWWATVHGTRLSDFTCRTDSLRCTLETEYCKSSTLHGKQTGETVETVSDFIFWAPKSLQMVTAAMKLKDAYSLEGKLWPT